MIQRFAKIILIFSMVPIISCSVISEIIHLFKDTPVYVEYDVCSNVDAPNYHLFNKELKTQRKHLEVISDTKKKPKKCVYGIDEAINLAQNEWRDTDIDTLDEDTEFFYLVGLQDYTDYRPDNPYGICWHSKDPEVLHEAICIVFVGKILDDALNCDDTLRIDIILANKIITAHECGHAYNLTHHDSCIMDGEFDICKPGEWNDKFCNFCRANLKVNKP